MKSLRFAGPVVAVLAGAVILSHGDAPSAQGPVTFSEHVAPIVFANCTSCHRPGEAAPFQLMSYRDARPLAKAIAAATAARVMPPWKAGPGDYAFENARSLTDEQINTIQRWVADGALEGDARKLPALPRFTEGWQLGPPDLVVTMSEPFEVPATGPDIYRGFVVPLNLDRDMWVRAVDFRPSARAVVHHSLFFLDSTGGARERDAQDPLPGFPGGMGGARVFGRGGGGAPLGGLLGRPDADPPDDVVARVSGGLGGWALGGRALELPTGLAFSVPKGSDLVLSTFPSVGEGAAGEVHRRPVFRSGTADAGIYDDSAATDLRSVRGPRYPPRAGALHDQRLVRDPRGRACLQRWRACALPG